MHDLKKGRTKSYSGPARLVQVARLATCQLMVHALKIPVDACHLGKPHPRNGLAILLPQLIKRKPVLLDCDDYEAASNRFDTIWQRRLVAAFENRLPAIATGITVNAHFTRERLERLGHQVSRIIYVPNGVDRERFSNFAEPSVNALRKQPKAWHRR